MSRDTQEYYDKVNKLMDVVDDMTSWEWDFVNNMAGFEDRGWRFSDKQAEVIDQLYERYGG